MPPKVKNYSTEYSLPLKCSERSTYKLKTVNRTKEGTNETAKFLRQALVNTTISTRDSTTGKQVNKTLYSYFSDYDWPSECLFTYPNTNWVGIFKKVNNDSNSIGDDNIYFRKDKPGDKYYFQLAVDSDGDPIITNYTYDKPSDLNGLSPCKVMGDKCMDLSDVPESSTNTTKSTTTKSTTTKSTNKKVNIQLEEPVVEPSNYSTRKGKEPLEESFKKMEIKDKSVKKTGPINIEYFNSLQSKEQIIDWMINNMEYSDIIACFDGSGASSMASTSNTVYELARNIPGNELRKMLKVVTKEEIMDQINTSKNTSGQKYYKLYNLCRGSGIIKPGEYTVKKYTYENPDGDMIETWGLINKSTGKPVSGKQFKELVERCSSREAQLLRRRILFINSSKNK